MVNRRFRSARFFGSASARWAGFGRYVAATTSSPTLFRRDAASGKNALSTCSAIPCGVQPKLMALVGGGAVLDEEVRHPDAVH